MSILSWICTEFTSLYMLIQLNFSHPLYVSKIEVKY